MRISRTPSWKKHGLIAAALLVSGLANAAPRFTDVQLSPSRVNVGDYVHVYFEVSDAGTPTPGSGSVEIGARRVCKSVATAIAGRYVCAFAIPHGGVFAYTLRFTPTGGAAIESVQTQIVGDLQLVKAKPAITQAGRASLFFAKLDYLDPGSRTQPTGTIVIETLTGSNQCTITLPALTHCAMLLPSAGTYSLRARYSGDASFPALTSSVFLHTVANPLRAQPVYRSQTAVLQSTKIFDSSFLNSGFLAAADRHGLRSVDGQAGVLDYSVGTHIPAYYESRSAIQVQPDGALAASYDFESNRYYFSTLRGHFVTAGLGGRLLGERVLFSTVVAWAAGDTNNANDFYLENGSLNDAWLTAKADGTASVNGVFLLAAGSEKVAFISAENGFTTDDSDGLPDVFVVTPGAIPPAARIRRYPLTPNFEFVNAIAMDEKDEQILLSGENLSLLDLGTGAIRELATGGSQVWRDGIFAPNGDALFQQSEPASIVHVPRGSGPRVWPIEADPFSAQLVKVLDSGEAQLLGTGTQRKINLSTGVNTLLFNNYVGDELLVRANSLSFNADGSRLAVTGIDGNFILVGGPSGARIALPSSAENAKLDPAGENVAFESSDPSLVPSDTNGFADVFIKNLRSNEIRRLSQTPGGGQTNTRTFLTALGSDYALISMPKPPQFFGSPQLLGAFQPVLISLRDNSATALVPPELEIMGFEASTDATAGIWVSRDRRRAYRQLTAPISAPVLINQLPSAEPFAFNSAAISSNGQIGVFAITRSRPLPLQDWRVDFTDNSTSVIKEWAPTESITSTYTLARNGEIALRREVSVSANLIDEASQLVRYSIIDFERSIEERLPISFFDRFRLPNSAGPPKPGPVELADNGGTMAWSARPNNLDQGLSWQRTPFAGTPTYTAITRVQPTQLFVAQSYLAEAVVSHKASDGAPSGLVRFDDGNGNQCDANLLAQGNLAIARCNLRSFPAESSDLANQTLSATYLGDARFAQSVGTRPITINLVSAMQFRLTAQMLGRAKVRVTPEFLPNSNVPLRGIVRISVLNSGSAGLSSQQFCELNAAQLALSASCDFSLENPEQLGRAFVSIIDDYYVAASTSAIINLREQLLSNGFE